MGAFGWLPDPPKGPGEKPDFNAALKLGTTPFPEKASARHLIWNILNQGGLGSCVANAGFQAIRASHMKQGVQNPKLGSRLFGYYLARAYQHMTALDSGTHLRLFFDALNKFGFPTEDAWPYSDDASEGAPFSRMPESTAFQAAFDQKNPTTYHRITEAGNGGRISSIKRAISQGFVVCFGTDVSVEFTGGLSSAHAPLDPPIGKEIAGGHAMCIAEYDGDTFGIVNSWGNGFGDSGWVRFTADYLAWDKSRDFWIVEHAPKYSDGP